MSYLTKLERLSGPLPVQCQVALGAIEVLEAESSNGIFSSEAMAEALTLAQDWLPVRDRHFGPINACSAGQWLGRLRERGYVEHVGPGYWRRTNGPVLHTEVPVVLIEEELCPV